jgi:hypothetical protein
LKAARIDGTLQEHVFEQFDELIVREHHAPLATAKV